jgi:hypothetical protein
MPPAGRAPRPCCNRDPFGPLWRPGRAWARGRNAVTKTGGARGRRAGAAGGGGRLRRLRHPRPCGAYYRRADALAPPWALERVQGAGAHPVCPPVQQQKACSLPRSALFQPRRCHPSTVEMASTMKMQTAANARCAPAGAGGARRQRQRSAAPGPPAAPRAPRACARPLITRPGPAPRPPLANATAGSSRCGPPGRDRWRIAWRRAAGPPGSADQAAGGRAGAGGPRAPTPGTQRGGPARALARIGPPAPRPPRRRYLLLPPPPVHAGPRVAPRPGRPRRGRQAHRHRPGRRLR